MKSFVVGLFLFLMLTLGCAGGYSTYTPEVLPMVRHSVAIQIPYGGSWRTIGSGVAVKKHGERYILTARHVAEAAEHVPLRACATLRPDSCVALPPGSMVGSAFPESIDDDWIKVKVKKFPRGVSVAQPAVSEPRVGDLIWVVGAPSGQLGEVTQGIVSNKKENVYFVDGRIVPGNSGGPVYNDSGHLIGIAVAIRVTPSMGPIPTWGIVVPLDEMDW